MPDSLDLTVSGVLFDMDGTLVDSTAVVESMWTAFAAEHGLDPAVVIAFAHGRPTGDTLVRFRPELAPAERAALEERFTAEEVARLEGIVEIPGAAVLMGALVEAGAPVAVVTSASVELATARMAAAGVPIPPVLVTPSAVARGKPAPDGFLKAAAGLGLRAEACLVFEDAEAGLVAARASGARVVVVGDHRSPTTEGLDRVPDLRAVTAARHGDALRVRAVAG